MLPTAILFRLSLCKFKKSEMSYCYTIMVYRILQLLKTNEVNEILYMKSLPKQKSENKGFWHN